MLRAEVANNPSFGIVGIAMHERIFRIRRPYYQLLTFLESIRVVALEACCKMSARALLDSLGEALLSVDVVGVMLFILRVMSLYDEKTTVNRGKSLRMARARLPNF